MNISTEESIDRYLVLNGSRVGEFKYNTHFKSYVLFPYVGVNLYTESLEYIISKIEELNRANTN